MNNGSRSLKNKVALITGSGRGIGRAIAERYGSLGASVIVNYAGDEKIARDVVAAAFRLKILFLVLACWNVVMFYVTGLASRVESLQEYDEPPTAAKLIAGTSLFLWVGVIFLGRVLPFAREAF